MKSRANEPPSETRVLEARLNQPEIARAAELAIANQRVDEARIEADAARIAAEEAEIDLQKLIIDD